MTETDQDTMALILAREQKDLEDSQLHNDDKDEVDSHDPSPRAAATASRHGRTKCEGSQDPNPSTSTAEAPATSADTATAVTPELIVTAPKLKWKNAMSRKSGKNYKSPIASPPPPVVAITHVKDPPPTPKTHKNNR